jgi:GGDEF domain-containing protein
MCLAYREASGDAGWSLLRRPAEYEEHNKRQRPFGLRPVAGCGAGAVKPGQKHRGDDSIGLSTMELKGEVVADVMKRADAALYRAKHDGRNRVVATAA